MCLHFHGKPEAEETKQFVSTSSTTITVYLPYSFTHITFFFLYSFVFPCIPLYSPIFTCLPLCSILVVPYQSRTQSLLKLLTAHARIRAQGSGYKIVTVYSRLAHAHILFAQTDRNNVYACASRLRSLVNGWYKHCKFVWVSSGSPRKCKHLSVFGKS